MAGIGSYCRWHSWTAFDCGCILTQGQQAGKVEGTVFGVAVNGIVIQKKGGTLVSLGVTDSTKVELNDVRVSLTDLPIGSHVEALFDTATNVASKVEVEK